MILRGNTASSWESTAMGDVAVVVSYRLVNRTSAPNLVSIAVVAGSETIQVVSTNLAANETFASDIRFKIKKADKIKITGAGSTDYYLNIE